MKLKRYFYPDQIEVGQKVWLSGDEFHHLASVMRTRVGDKVELFNGDKNNYVASVDSIEKKFAVLLVESKQANMQEPKIQLDVFQALAKGDKLSLVMQKITELGASNMFVFESKFCDVKANTGKLDRLDLVSISACKQCGRSTLVSTQGVLELKDVCSLVKNYDAFLVCYEDEDQTTLASEIEKLKNTKFKKVAVMVGAEGGFDKSEIELLKKSGAKIISLGSRILRTETAAIASVATIMQMLEN